MLAAGGRWPYYPVMPDELSSQLASLRIDRDAPRSASGVLRWLLALAALVLLGVAAYVYVLPRLESQIFKTEVSFTEVLSISPAQASVELTAAGYVVPQRVSRVAPKVPGKVLQVHVAQGQQVQPGDLLLSLDTSDERADIRAARSSVQAAIARADSARAQAATARAELAEVRVQADRQRRLAGEGVTASGVAEDLAARVTSLEHREVASRAAADAARAEAAAQRSQVDVLETRLKNLELRAPIAGTVTTKPPQVGEVVSPQPPGVSVDMGGVEIADFASLMVEVDVPEQRLHRVQLGAPAEIVLDAFPSSRYRGKLAEITPQVNRSKATVVVRVAFVDEKRAVLPDMAARVSFLSEPLDPAALKQPPKIVVPGSAVTERAGGKVVFVVEDDEVRMRSVVLGGEVSGGFELVEGPRSGTRLVADPPAALADGQRIKGKESQ